MGPILGPTFGGEISELLGWRWSFFLILPLGLAAGGLAWLALDDREKGLKRPFDRIGFLFVAIAIAAAQLMFDRGQRNDWFELRETIAEAGIAALFFTMFAIHSLTTTHPLFDPAAFRDRNFAVGLVVAAVMGMLQYGPMVLFPPLLQELQGYPEALIGSLVATRGLGNFASFFVVAQLTRRSPRLCLFLGLGLQALAGVWMGSFDINLTSEVVLWSNVLHGFGFGLSYTPMAVLAFSTLEPRLLTQANALFSLVRMLGSSLFVSLVLVVLVHSTAEASVNLASSITAFTRDLTLPWTLAFGSLGESQVLARLAAEVQRQASMVGYVNAFHLLTLVPLLAAPVAFLFARRAPMG